ncbi:MAG: hypothetical protein R3A13_07000 [Bdellovibrionota bacterium]
MQPNFVYLRFGILLLVLYFLCWRFVRLSLRSDLGFLREKASDKGKLNWKGQIPKCLHGVGK